MEGQRKISMVGLMCSPQKTCLSSNPGPCDCDLNWKKGLCRCNQIKMRLYEIRVGPKFNGWCLNTRKQRGIWTRRHRQTDRQTGLCNSELEMRVMKLQPKNSKDCQQTPEPRKRRERIFPRGFSGSTALLTPEFQPSGLQSINFYSPVNGDC